MYHSVAVTMRERRARSQREEDVGQRSLCRTQVRGGDYPRLDSCCPWARDSGLRKGSRSAPPPPLARVRGPLFSIYNMCLGYAACIACSII